MMTYPPPYIVEPENGQPHTHTIILLHGRSSTAEEFANDIFALSSSTPSQHLPTSFPDFRWVFPDAGKRWCTPFKEEQSAWFDTWSLDDLSMRQDLQVSGLRDGIRLVKAIVEKEVERLSGRADKVILGGFSQGSATALWSLLTGAAMTKGSLGAFLGLSAWMPFTSEAMMAAKDTHVASREGRIRRLGGMISETLGIEELASTGTIQEGLQQLPVYLGHGTDDALINVANCHELSAVLSAIGADVEVREYVGADREGHWLKEPEQMDDVLSFLSRIVTSGK